MNRSFFFLPVVRDLARGRLPGQIIIQMTDRCNAACPHCGMRRTNDYSRHDLAVDDIKRIIDAAAARGVQAISFTGGEPLLRLEALVQLITHAGKAGIPMIRTGTNGFFLRQNGLRPDRWSGRVRDIAEKLAATPLRNFWISLDSCVPEVHEEMRGLPGVVAGMEKALPIFHDCGIYPAVNLGVNRKMGGLHTYRLDAAEYADEDAYLEQFYQVYRQGLENFYRRIRNLGFTMANTCYPMSVDQGQKNQPQAVYAATASDRLVRFRRAEKAVLFQVLLETVEKHRPFLRIFSPLTSLYTLYREYNGSLPRRLLPAPCRGGSDFFFIDARRGDTYPCGYRGQENLGKYWNLSERHRDRGTECRRCDWECFRDPSELLAPLLPAVTTPLRLMNRLLHDQAYLRHWLKDLSYYRACGFFDGRQPPQPDRLADYSSGDPALRP